MALDSLKYQIEEWVNEDGKRHVWLLLSLRVVPYVRQTRNSRWRDDKVGDRVREYNDSQAAIRDAVSLVLRKEMVQPFGQVSLGMALDVFLCPKRIMGKRMSVIDDVRRADLGNYEKACEDALQGALFPNDKLIWRRGEGGKHIGKEDYFEVHVWELMEVDDAPYQ